MFSKGSQECLYNAKSLINDAKILMSTNSFGTAQSLSVTAFEEVGKATILQLANLNYVEKSVVEMAMRKHLPKKVILIGIEQSRLLLGEKLANQASEYILDEATLKKLQKNMRKDIRDLEKKRQNGFYVDVDPEDGTIRNIPTRINPRDVQSLIDKAEVFLRVGEILCDILIKLKEGKVKVAIREVKLPEFTTKEIGAQPDYTLTIVWDEILEFDLHQSS